MRFKILILCVFLFYIFYPTLTVKAQVKNEGYIIADKLNIREEPSTNATIVGSLLLNDKVIYQQYNDNWAIIKYNDKKCFISIDYICDLPFEYSIADEKHLTKQGGIFKGPSGMESYYNLPMAGVVKIMRSMGYEDRYWVRNDGVKMFGKYVMTAANLDRHPRGNIVKTSLGLAIVCDTGDFVYNGSGMEFDIAVAW